MSNSEVLFENRMYVKSFYNKDFYYYKHLYYQKQHFWTC